MKRKKLKRMISLILCLLMLCMSGCKNNNPSEIIVNEPTSDQSTPDNNTSDSDATISDSDAGNLDISVADAFGNRKSIVTIISDDGYYDSGLNLDALLEKHKMTATVAGAVSIVSKSEPEWLELLGRGRIHMVSHSKWHVRMEEGSEISGNEEELRDEIVGASEYYVDFLGEKPICFVCPENAMCELGYKILSEDGYIAVRRGDRGLNPISPEEGVEPGNWHNLRTRGILDVETTEERNAWVDDAINEKAWLIEMWHNVKPEDDGMYQTVLTEDADSHMSYIQKKSDEGDIWVTDFETATKYIYEKQHTEVAAACSKDGNISVICKMTEDVNDKGRFDVPITVSVKLSEDAEKDAVYVDENGDKIKAVDGVLTFSIIPQNSVTILKKK